MIYFSGARYNSGSEFCQGQKFEVVENNGNCFDFDPLVFGYAPRINPSVELLVLSLIYFLMAIT